MPNYIPDRQTILSMSDPEFAQSLLRQLHCEIEGQREGFTVETVILDNRNEHTFIRHNAVMRVATKSVGGNLHTMSPDRPPDVMDRAMASMSWLEKNGYIAPAFGQDGLYQITQTGIRAAANLPDLPLPDASLLPFEQLHPRLQTRAWHDFVRQDYSGAIFKAFQEVEIAVRTKSGLDQGLTGAQLMRKAFDKTNGPLTDQHAESSEKEAMAHLFAGAFGSLRNPNGHRTMEYTGPEIPRGAIMLADMLLRFVDEASSTFQSVIPSVADQEVSNG